MTLKLVQVYVTDKKGNPILDLTKDDFVIYDNGKKQDITEFEKYVLSFPSLEAEDKLKIIKETPLQPDRELMSRKFFLFFDFAYNNAKGIIKAREAALHFIDTQLQPSDKVGVLSFSSLKSLTLHEYLTTNHQKIRQIVEKSGIKEITGRAENFEAEYWQAVADENPKDASKAGWVFDKPDPGIISRQRKESLVQILNFTQKMIELAKAMRYTPGHKYIILFSSGVPYTLVYGIQSPYRYQEKYEIGENIQSWGETLLKQRYEEMLKELSASNCAIYALDTEEARITLEADLRMTGAFSLEKMASETGGKYFGNINKYEKHLEKIQNLTGSYYVLGYYIDEKWDGAYHKIKVEVKRPGCKVHAQKGYFNSKPFSEYSQLEKQLHLVDLALSEKPLFLTPLRFPLATLSCSVDKEANLCLIAKIPLEKIQEILEGKVEIISLIFDSAENIVDLRRGEANFSQLPGENAYYYSLFSLPPGSYKCRLVIRNLETGRGAVGSSSATILETKKKGIELYPPLLLSPEKNAIYVKGLPPKKSAQRFASLSLTDYFHYDTTQYSPYIDDSLQRNSTVPAVVVCSIFDISAPEVEISASLIEKSSGETIPLTVSVLSDAKKKDKHIFFIHIQIRALPQGEYALNLVAKEKTSQTESQVTKIFKIK
ncbi:MAG: VWA domain-containing protein [Acidobacteriota bacterium]